MGCLLLGLAFAAALPGTGFTGIWEGRLPGAEADPGADVAFEFKLKNGVLAGRQFADEFDLAANSIVLNGDTLTFTVTSMNYYSREAVKFRYSAKLTSSATMEMTRQHLGAGQAKSITFTLRRTTRH